MSKNTSTQTQAVVDQAASDLVGVLAGYFGLDVTTDAALARYREDGHPDLDAALEAFEAAVGGVATAEELAVLRSVIEAAAADLNGAWLGMWSAYHDAQADGLSKIQGPLDACCTIWSGHAELVEVTQAIETLTDQRREKQDATEEAIAALDVETATTLMAEVDRIPGLLREAERRRAQLLLERATAYLELPAARAEANEAATEDAVARWQEAEKALAAAEQDTNRGRYRALALGKSAEAARAELAEATAQVAAAEAARVTAKREHVRRVVSGAAR